MFPSTSCWAFIQMFVKKISTTFSCLIWAIHTWMFFHHNKSDRFISETRSYLRLLQCLLVQAAEPLFKCLSKRYQQHFHVIFWWYRHECFFSHSHKKADLFHAEIGSYLRLLQCLLVQAAEPLFKCLSKRYQQHFHVIFGWYMHECVSFFIITNQTDLLVKPVLTWDIFNVITNQIIYYWNWFLPETSTTSPGTSCWAFILCTPLWFFLITLAISGSYSFRASMALSALRSWRTIEKTIHQTMLYEKQ